MRKTLLLCILGCTIASVLRAQIGGEHVYSFLSLSPSAQASALGGSVLAGERLDVSLASGNPAILDQDMDMEMSIQHQFLAGGVQSGYAGWGRWLKSAQIMTHLGFKYVLYGDFVETDIFGSQLGQFKGSEVAVHLGAAYQVYDNLKVGANIKFISSSLEVYRSSGLAFDLGATYTDTASRWTVAMVLRNQGWQLSYFEDVAESLPVDLQIGVAHRLRHLPFQLSITYHNLHRWNLLYDDPNSEENTFFGGFQPVNTEPSRFDNFFRHIILGGELFLGKEEVFSIRLGYNHQRKQELSVNNLRSLTGFSAGIGLNLSKFRFHYSLYRAHFGASTHHLGFSTNLRSFTGGGILN